MDIRADIRSGKSHSMDFRFKLSAGNASGTRRVKSSIRLRDKVSEIDSRILDL